MNGGIALARIKVPYVKIAHNIKGLRGHDFTLDQLMALAELLPTDEERRLLLAYKGDVEVLGEADKFMLQASGPSAAGGWVGQLLGTYTFQTIGQRWHGIAS